MKKSKKASGGSEGVWTFIMWAVVIALGIVCILIIVEVNKAGGTAYASIKDLFGFLS